jgi:ubiquinone/menaquinone biosynthesis C-methylase UbiE
MEDARKTFIPAAGVDWTLPLYDPLVKLLGGDRVRRSLVEQADLVEGQTLLDVGCGTGSLVALVRSLNPGVQVTGIDPDPKALERARRKAVRAGVSIRLDQGFADALPYPDGSFDRVLSSFMFHHVPPAERPRMLGEARRILKPGGSLHLLDFDGPEPGSGGHVARLFRSGRLLRDNGEARILELMRAAGFEDPTRVSGGRLLLGLLAYSSFRAVAPTA